MLSLSRLKEASLQVEKQRQLEGRPRPGKGRLRPRTPEKVALLRKIGEIARSKNPPYLKEIDGERVLILPFNCSSDTEI